MATQEAVQGFHSSTYVKNETNGYDYGYPNGSYSGTQLYNPYMHYEDGQQSYDHLGQHHYNPHQLQVSEQDSHYQQHPAQPMHHYGHIPEMGHHHQQLHYGNMMPIHSNAHSYKEEMCPDPYSFVDEAANGGVKHEGNVMETPKKRGRKKKIKSKEGNENLNQTIDFPVNSDSIDGQLAQRKYSKPEHYKQRRRHDRFNGMTEEEVRSRTLPDHLTANLDVVIIGINPGLFAAYKGHHYAGPGNHFWKCLYLAGLVPEPMTADDDSKLLHFGIGFTNMVARATKGSADLTRKEIREGGRILLEKLQKFRPKIAVFNGKGIYEVFSGKKEFTFGKQPECIDGTNTFIWVMPSSSARCAQLPRAMDKVPFYAALKKFRDYINGLIPEIDENEVIFNDPKIRAADDGTEISEHLKVDSVSSDDLTGIGGGDTPESGQQLENAPLKKKRGRPKKIKTEGSSVKDGVQQQQQPHLGDSSEAPKKKRGRPKKIRADDTSRMVLPAAEGSNGPIDSGAHSGSYFNQTGSASGGQQQHQTQYYSHSQQWSGNGNGSMAEVSPHHSSASSTPLTPATTSPKQPELDPGASIGSAHRISPVQGSSGSEHQQQTFRSPPSDYPHDSAVPNGSINGGNMHTKQHVHQPQHAGNSQQQPSMIGYHRPTPSAGHHIPYVNQDMATKSLSGLESLVDQIPNVASNPHSVPHDPNVQQHSTLSINHSPHPPGTGYQQQTTGYPPHQQQTNQQAPGNYSAYPTTTSSSSFQYGPPAGFHPSYHQDGTQPYAPIPPTGYAMTQTGSSGVQPVPNNQQPNAYATYPGYAQYSWAQSGAYPPPPPPQQQQPTSSYNPTTPTGMSYYQPSPSGFINQ